MAKKHSPSDNSWMPAKIPMKKGGKLKKMPGGGELKPTAQQLTNQNRTDWNTYIDWLDKQGEKGKPELDKDSLGFQLLDQYDKQFPNTTINRNTIPLIQGDFANYRNYALNQIKQGGGLFSPGTNENNFMSNLSKVDGYPGQRTTSFKFPEGYLKSYEDKQYIGTEDRGYATTNTHLKEGGTIPMAKSGIGLKPLSYMKNGGIIEGDHEVDSISDEEIKNLRKQGYEVIFK